MNQSDEDGIDLNRGYDIGFLDGLKRAYDLVGNLGDFYESNNAVNEDVTNEEKSLHENAKKSQVNACRYAQHVIRKNSFGEDDLPW